MRTKKIFHLSIIVYEFCIISLHLEVFSAFELDSVKKVCGFLVGTLIEHMDS